MGEGKKEIHFNCPLQIPIGTSDSELLLNSELLLQKFDFRAIKQIIYELSSIIVSLAIPKLNGKWLGQSIFHSKTGLKKPGI